ncbi:very-long-chain (3R)-3-hydroxyacyl-CoA dehydratase 2 isoform X2 [Meriones unguiculatus]|uniref:very-long-chain (3R)-3-hydroxyacyl-CoA dehydratase 2 isoform X2 n=1 Tax=Meriones unguiculatus TaxID=10047 RepID=UPI00293E7DBE|nr:very-long-chain (3R)-3-hydroxyacyl-CoA dehydratase 2 isoform X2 [Meriones unguiculatus]
MAAAAATAATKGNGGGGGRAGAGEGGGGGGTRKKKGPGPVATAYLVIYNVVMTAGWLVIAVGLGRAYLAKGSYHSLYYSIEKPLKFFQTGALLEILHCAIGIVPSSVVLTSFQVMSRVFLIWAVTHSVKETQPLKEVLKKDTVYGKGVLRRGKKASHKAWSPEFFEINGVINSRCQSPEKNSVSTVAAFFCAPSVFFECNKSDSFLFRDSPCAF